VAIVTKPITLSKPLTYGAGTLKELSFRRPMAGDLRGLKLGGLPDMDVDLVVKLAVRTSIQTVTEAQLHELDPADFIKVANEVVGFFGDVDPSQTTPDAPGD
jgi:hypothetical protein